MKRMVLRSASVVLIVAVLAVASVGCQSGYSQKPAQKAPEQASASGEEATIVGKLSCTGCNLMSGGKPCPPGCCSRCVGNGDPTLLTDADGVHYILLTGEKGEPLMNDERLAMLGGDVSVGGTVVKSKGVNAIYVESMTKR